MTKIMVVTNDQILIAAEKPKIASGDINSVIFAAEFDATWDDFINRTASFYTSHNSNPIDSLMIDNECVVPAEVLANPGTLYVGVVGVTADGQRVKTSNYVSFKIIKGAEHSHTTVAPELNLYQQYLSAVKDEIAPIVVALQASFEDRVAALQADYEEKKEALDAMFPGDELWTNPSPTASFAAQTVDLDLAEYKRIVVVYYHGDSEDATKSTYSESTCCLKDLTYHHACVGSTNYENYATTYWRTFKFTNGGVVFGDAYDHASKGNVTNNASLIPYKIIGYKY